MARSGFCLTSLLRSAIGLDPPGKALATLCGAFEFMRRRRVTLYHAGQAWPSLLHIGKIYVLVGIHDYFPDNPSMDIPPFVIDNFFTIKAKPSQRIVRFRDCMLRNYGVVEYQLHQPDNKIFMFGI